MCISLVYMEKYRYQYRSEFSFSSGELFDWIHQKDSWERLLPPWIWAKIYFRSNNRFGIDIRFGFLHKTWVMETSSSIELEYREQQIEGPFLYWLHVHRVRTLSAKSCLLEDEVFYSLPFFLFKRGMERCLLRIFSYQHEIVKHDLRCYNSHSKKPLKVLMSGSSGFIGKTLSSFLRLAGHKVIPLRRGMPRRDGDQVFWNPSQDELHIPDFEGFDAVIHLAGENIAQGMWTERKKERIFQSRCRDTFLLSKAISRLQNPPKTVITASAVGIYGDRKEVLVEDSLPGEGFLPDLCVRWEASSESLREKGIRLVHARLGYVLSRKGGMLQALISLFQWGLGGTIAGGRQAMPWIALEDVVRAFYHLLSMESLSGPVNLVSLEPTSQKQFANMLAKALHRPACLHVPKCFVLGEKAKTLLLSSLHVLPKKLIDTGFEFQYSRLEDLLKDNV